MQSGRAAHATAFPSYAADVVVDLVLVGGEGPPSFEAIIALNPNLLIGNYVLRRLRRKVIQTMTGNPC